MQKPGLLLIQPRLRGLGIGHQFLRMGLVPLQDVQPAAGFRQGRTGAGFGLGGLFLGDAGAFQRRARLRLGGAKFRQGGFGVGGAGGGLRGRGGGFGDPGLGGGESGLRRVTGCFGNRALDGQ